jgi:hypothetical protein
LSLLLRNSNAKFLLASLKTLTNFRNPFINPLQEHSETHLLLVKLAPEPAVILKIVHFNIMFCKQTMTCQFKKLFPCPMRGDHSEKPDQ